MITNITATILSNKKHQCISKLPIEIQDVKVKWKKESPWMTNLKIESDDNKDRNKNKKEDVVIIIDFNNKK